MGVANIWLFDPIERVACTYSRNGFKLVEAGRIAVADSPVSIDLGTIFAEQD